MSARNGHDPTSVPADERDWIGEAAKMVAVPRQTMMLPEYGHVEALYDELVPLQKIVALQNRALIALLLQMGQSGFAVNPRIVQKIEGQGLDIAIARPSAGDPITVRLLRPAPTSPTKG